MTKTNEKYLQDLEKILSTFLLRESLYLYEILLSIDILYKTDSYGVINT